MSPRTRGLVLLAIGVLLVVVGLAADAIGLGGHPGIGKRQVLALVVGILLLLAGVWGLRKSG